MQNNIVTVQNLKFYRGDRAIYRSIDLAIKRGKITAIMGPSGCGKTTLLRLIAAQLRPNSGKIKLNDIDLATVSRKELYEMRKRVGMLFQSGALFTDLSVFENVAFALREHTTLPETMIRDLVLMKLEAVGLRGAKDLMPRELSGGMARRVAFARAISLDPELMMFDEPFAGQDPISMGVLATLIKRLNSAMGMTSIIVSHDIVETLAIADYVYIVANAKIMAQGSPDELNNSQDAWTRQFLDGTLEGPVPFHYPATDYLKELLG